MKTKNLHLLLFSLLMLVICSCSKEKVEHDKSSTKTQSQKNEKRDTKNSKPNNTSDSKVENEDKTIIKSNSLYKKPDIKVAIDRSKTPKKEVLDVLFKAFDDENYEKILELLQEYPILVYKDDEGFNAFNGYFNFFEEYKDKYNALKKMILLGADVNGKDHKGITPLHLAVGIRDIKLVELLLRAGANPKYESDNGKSYLHALDWQTSKPEAIEFKCVKLLLEFGANPNIILDDTYVKGLTPLDAIHKRFKPEFQKKWIDLLKKYGAKTAAELKEGK